MGGIFRLIQIPKPAVMKRDFFDENFEWFLRRQADSFRMDASDKVWSHISRELHKRRRRINLSLAALFLLVSGFGYFFISHSVKPIPSIAQQNSISQPAATAPEKKIQNQNVTSVKPSQPVVVESKTVSQNPVVADAGMTNNKSAVTDVVDKTLAQNTMGTEDFSANLRLPTATKTEWVSPGQTQDDLAQEPMPSSTEVAEALADQVDLNANYVVHNTLNSNTIRKRKLDWQLSFTPTISYRKLGENKSYLRTASSLSANNPIAPLYSVNSMVTHKPDLGLELGASTKYKLTDNIKLIGGLQFNINRYDIKAFNGPYAVGTIQLNNGSSISSVNTVTGYSNTNGYHTNWLKNFYFQVSTPIGVELKLHGTENMHFGIATSVQPSYLVGDRAYLITSDYKSYVQVPWLVRRWNANTNLQTFVSYSTGKMRWQVGPQVRYQLLSSFISEYPVKENLFDFGLKVGISLNKE